MASVKLTLRGKKNPSKLYVRFTNGKNIDFSTAVGILINPDHWSQAKQETKNNQELNLKLAKLKIHIIESFNNDYMNGEIIDNDWFKKTVAKSNNRPKYEVHNKNLSRHIYLTDYASYWLEEKAEKRKVSHSKYISQKTIQHYRITNNLIKEFEGEEKIKFRKITSELMDEFSIWLSDNDYAEKSVKRMVTRLKFFCERAEEDNIEVNKEYKKRVFIKQADLDYKEPYLNEYEIHKLFNYDFSYNKDLDNARDNLIIGLWTGLRISDFLNRLDIRNFVDGFIEIKTAKTKTPVSIPVHKHIDSILKKRNGELPKKMSDNKFNELIKNIGQILEFDEIMIGGVTCVDLETKRKRKIIGEYKKYELITSHICRRSFCTNLFGKISNQIICKIAGWSNEEQMLQYVKQTNRESAMQLQKYWEISNQI